MIGDDARPRPREEDSECDPFGPSCDDERELDDDDAVDLEDAFAAVLAELDHEHDCPLAYPSSGR